MTVASMLESVRVSRRCWWKLSEREAKRPQDAFVEFHISWTTPQGVRVDDRRMFDARKLLAFRAGVVPMLTAIFGDPEESHIVAHVYLLRTADDVVARLIVQRTHAVDPGEPFTLDGRLDESGPNIYSLPIEDEWPED